MKDIDFDELDRAVNSLMSGVPKAEPAKQDDTITVSLTPATEPEASVAAPTTPSSLKSSSPDESEQPAKSEQSTPSRPSPVSAIAVPPAARRGRFMDVMRPGAQEQRKPSLSRTASRQGPTIQPASGFTQPQSAPVGDTPTPIPESPVNSDTLSVGDFPDPLAGIDFNATTEAVAAKATQSELRVSQVGGNDEGAQGNEASSPIVSPFLPDAKVEKRPLGRPADADVASDADSELGRAPALGVLASSTDDTEGDIGGEIQIPKQPLPVELGQEVMAIEADTSSLTLERSDMTESVTHAPAPRPTTSAPSSAPTRPVATSIQQQYKVHPQVSEPPVSSGAIYDSATYHQPLAHPAKKQPGWQWIAIIILILLVGAAAGAAVYYYGLV